MLTRRTRAFRLGPALLVLMMVIALSTALIVNAQNDPPPTVQNLTGLIGPNLLENPYFDAPGFYFRFPNSLVAPMWFRWDVTRPDGPNPIPEFIDGGSPYHNACYPEPSPGGLCFDMNPRNRSQGYIKMGGPYIAGVWQPVPATPCLDYQFAGYVRTDSSGYRPKVGIDPTGWRMPPKTDPNPDLDYNCPPDGHSLCPKEHFSYESDMPASIVWSAPYAYDPPTPPITWRGPVSITTEALSTTMTVWTFTAPDQSGSQSTYWDSMFLYQVPKQTLLPNGLIPTPDGTIQPAVTPGRDTAQIEWSTSRPAFDQVFYRVHLTVPPPPCTGTACLCPDPGTVCIIHSQYLPIVRNDPHPVSVNDYAYHTDPTSLMATTHSPTLTGLEPGTVYDYVAVSRSFNNGACIPSVSATGVFTTTP